MKNSPVFIVGSARSGTSFLYSLLLASGNFAIYEAETHLLRTCPAKYGSLSRDKNWERFLKDWLRSKQFKRSNLNAQQFAYQALHHRSSYIELLGFFMEQICKAQGKQRWAENTPNHIYMMREIAAFFPDAKFIHIVRDGRAVASSLIKLGWVSSKFSRKSQLITAGIAWEHSILKGKSVGERLPGRYLEIRFEDLIFLPEITLEKIGNFLSINIDVDRLMNRKVGVIGKQNTAFGNRENSKNELFVKSSVTRWQEILTEKDKYILDATISKTLEMLGYDCNDEKSFTLTINKVYYNVSMLCKELLKYKFGVGRYLSSGLEE